MNLEEAQRKLLQVHEQQKRLTIEIDTLKAIIIGYGVEPYRGFSELKERNNEIYKLCKKECQTRRLRKNTICQRLGLLQSVSALTTKRQ